MFFQFYAIRIFTPNFRYLVVSLSCILNNPKSFYKSFKSHLKSKGNINSEKEEKKKNTKKIKKKLKTKGRSRSNNGDGMWFRAPWGAVGCDLVLILS